MTTSPSGCQSVLTVRPHDFPGDVATKLARDLRRSLDAEVSARHREWCEPPGEITWRGLMSLSVLRELRTKLDALELAYVSRATRERATWQQIGNALGITRQSAHTKYAGRVAKPTPTEKRAL